jgi:mycoketide-CoA synthase
LFAVMVALARLWESYGVRPAAVVGHSHGEIAAACVAGALSLEDAAKVVALRSRALVSLSGGCGMASVAMAAEEAERYLAVRQGGPGRPGAVSVAVVNRPRATVLGGPLGELRKVVASLESVGVEARMLPVDYASHTPKVESTEAEILAQLADIKPGPARVPFYSTVSGAAIDTAGLTAEYWYRNLRQTVRFDAAVRAMLADGHRVFVEASPHPALLQWLEQIAEDVAVDDVVAIGSLRRDDGGMDRFVRSLATAHVRGVEFDGRQAFARWGPRPVDLPTYPFQNRRLWLADAPPADTVDTAEAAAAFGLDSTGHPWLTGVVALPETGGRLLTGCLSLRTSPWLADHAIHEQAVVPGAAIVEMAIRAAEEAGCASVAELTLHRPMVVPPDGRLRLQVSVGAPGADGRRPVTVFSRPDHPSADGPWIRHADGLLAVEDGATGQLDLTAWPPADARSVDSVDMASLYARFDEHGIGYGPAFQAVTAAWQRDDALYAEVSLPAGQRDERAPFGLHPALFDAALHVIGSALLGHDGGVPLLPFSWAGVSLHDWGATELRVRLEPAGDGGYRLFASDAAGKPVLSVKSLALLPAAELCLPGNSWLLESLYVPVWRPVAATRGTSETWAVLDDPGVAAAVGAANHADMDSLRSALRSGVTVPDVVVLPPGQGKEGDHGPLRRALAALQTWINDELTADSHLVLLTRRAVAARPKEAADPEQAAVWGLVRSAQSENPGRFTLVDIDDAPESLRALRTAVAGGEPQLAIRAGAPMAPRLAHAFADSSASGASGASGTAALAAEGTVLLTGGTGALGGALARHLVVNHGVRHLLLASRSGPQAPGAAELAAELGALGASVEVAAADVARRADVAALLAGIPAEHPLTAVVHAAGTLADGFVETLTAEQVATVMAAKAGGARHLDELTREHQLAAFVVFSSCAATFGSIGQGSYAAANAYVEGLAQRRRALGLPATALAWGRWEQRSELTARSDTAALDQLAPGASTAPLSTMEGLALFDAAWLSDDVVSVPVKLAPISPGEPVASVLRDLVRPKTRRSASPTDAPAAQPSRDAHRDLVRSLLERGAAERHNALVELVRTHAAAVLGQEAAAQLTPKRSFREVGLESLSAADLRNRLSSAIGKRLTATVVFDHPTPAKLAKHIAALILPHLAAGDSGDAPSEARRKGDAA